MARLHQRRKGYENWTKIGAGIGLATWKVGETWYISLEWIPRCGHWRYFGSWWLKHVWRTSAAPYRWMVGRSTYIITPKRECVRQCTCSHAPFQGQIWENLIKFIGNCRANFNPERKRKFSGGSVRVSYKGKMNWNRNGDKWHNMQNPDIHAPGNGAVSGCSRGGHVGGVRQDENNGRVGCERWGPGHNPPPHQDGRRQQDGGKNCWERGRST